MRQILIRSFYLNGLEVFESGSPGGDQGDDQARKTIKNSQFPDIKPDKGHRRQQQGS